VLQAGLPSTLRDRRPDVRQTEEALGAASALIGAAKAREYRTFPPTGVLGVQSADLADLADLDARLPAAREALRITRIRHEAGDSVYLEVLDAQRTQNVAERVAIRNRQARLAFSVDLMKALGGGWRPPEALGSSPPR
jgi:outer membrane protein TolC